MPPSILWPALAGCDAGVKGEKIDVLVGLATFPVPIPLAVENRFAEEIPANVLVEAEVAV